MKSCVSLLVILYLASCPGSLHGREVEPGTHCLCLLNSPRISGGLETSGYLFVRHHATIHSTRIVGEIQAPGSI